MRLGAPLKFMVFAVIMTVLTGFLIMVFGNFRGGPAGEYSAVFTDTSRLKAGDSVRVAGVVVGTVDDVALRQDHKVAVSFVVDRNVVLTEGTQAAVRYLNLVGDRYLELRDAPGSARLLAAGAQIPVERTEPALDLDLLLGGLKPVLRSLNATDVDAFSFALVQILQGQGGTLASLFSRTSSFSAAIADNSAVVAQAIEKLNIVTNTLADNGQQFSDSVDRLQRLVTGLAAERDPIGTAIGQLSAGTASVADLLADSRAPLAGTVDQLSRLAPLLDQDKERIDVALQKAPENYRKLVRIGSYGSFINYYFCAATIRLSDLQGRTVVAPWIRNPGGRCGEP
ncbi:MCE family protein [Mycolicibacterium hippocampi]|uniref:Mammalian cell entry protein n=1 Tax=Mycolicibacterium hippocampi TaxID=659824 RepID=A0A7I9ZSP1_9MYCO|nr:MCE family protein [Mycolicibacterium hippocampi]GFH03757.1 mammalian cell entry protein [Mycolicibacterium hippocampi]